VDRFLIVNADDFGLSSGINRGIIQAHERGIVTSGSLMVRGPATAEAAAYVHEHPTFSLGLHIDLGEWRYVGDGKWKQLYSVAATDDAEAVGLEVVRQLEQFRAITGSDPSHLDSHQHVHLDEPARSALIAMSANLGVPLRRFTRSIRYSGAFYGQTGKGEPLPEAITVEALADILAALPAGVTELGCHPGLGLDAQSAYEVEREIEVRTLCDPQVQEAVTAAGVKLISFADVARLGFSE
jgi:predicted glycoside hydrolase/deacetylase ChbG (UPF0249 family)